MDTDGDGVPDDEDAFPNDPAASVDAWSTGSGGDRCIRVDAAAMADFTEAFGGASPTVLVSQCADHG